MTLKTLIIGGLMAFGFVTGCGNSEPPECSAEVACEFGEVCLSGSCEVVGCANSSQCPMEHSCESGTCTPGCTDDDDCYPGDACDATTGECSSEGCTDSHLDCGFNEFCNEFSGDCYDAGGYYCKKCNDDTDCGGNGNLCTGWGYCGVTCETDSDCPSGLSCFPFVDINGNIMAYQCLTYCWLYDDLDGSLDRSRPTPAIIDPEFPTCPSVLEAM
jgi:hypothetical protein